MNSRIANKVRVKKGTIPENVLLELENARVGGSSTPSYRTPSTAIVYVPVVAGLQGPSGGHTLEFHAIIPEGPLLEVGGSGAAQGEPRKSHKRRGRTKEGVGVRVEA
ncbi:UNVERIFIED_CONTAM: hypothetical protein Slati_1114500 [Sesamum latifolium]|uniref:Uncharacterized protein n=1 Tax=Sesamum latifolium TaxID=2727402 RepID=A0AAW2XDS1_9LAMI